MLAVAEGFVLRRTAAAKGHAVAELVFEAIGAYHWDAAAQPDRSGAILGRIFDQGDRRIIFWLHRFAGGVVPRHQPPRWTVAGLLHEVLACRRVVRSVHEIPHPPLGVTEARKSGHARAGEA